MFSNQKLIICWLRRPSPTLMASSQFCLYSLFPILVIIFLLSVYLLHPPTMTRWLNLVSLYEYYLRRTFTSSGLTQQSLQIDSQTTISFWGPTQSTPEKPSLLLLHGFGPNPIWQWGPQVKFLSPHFNLYVPELLFFGASTTKSSERSEVFQAVSMAKLLEKLGVERYCVMGTSYGGFVAYNVARLFGERVERVVIGSSGVNKTLKDNVELLQRAKVVKIEDLMLPKSPKQLTRLLEVVMVNPPNYLPDFFLNFFIKALYSDNLKEKKELLKGLTFGHDDQVHVSPLQQDVLIVWGEHDQIFPLKKARELKELLGEKARLEVMKNTSHTPQLEDSDKFNDIVIKFFSGTQ